MSPNTPKERAEDLKAIGAVVEKLPSFKRGEFVVKCPKCGCRTHRHGYTIKFFPEARFVGPHALPDRIRLDDETCNRGSAWEETYTGDSTWRQCRAHILACTGGELDDEKRRSALNAIFSLRRSLENVPEMTRKVLHELVGFLDDVRIDQNKRNAAAETFLGDAVHSLRSAADILIDPEPLPSATREERAKAKEASDARVREGTRAVLASFPAALERAGAAKK